MGCGTANFGWDGNNSRRTLTVATEGQFDTSERSDHARGDMITFTDDKYKVSIDHFMIFLFPWIRWACNIGQFDRKPTLDK